MQCTGGANASECRGIYTKWVLEICWDDGLRWGDALWDSVCGIVCGVMRGILCGGGVWDGVC